MERISQNEKLEELLSKLQDKIDLSEEELLELYRLNDCLETEFGDISENVDNIFNEFWSLYNQIPMDSSLKKPLSQESPAQLHNPKYYEDRDIEVLERLLGNERYILEQWSKYFFEIVLTRLFGHLEGRILNGGIKSRDSIQERIASRRADGRPQPLNFIRDLIRGRFIGERLVDVEKAIEILRETSIGQIVTIINAYHSLFIDWRKSRGVKPYVASNFTFKIDDNLTYELQILTNRAALIGKIDHPIRIKPTVELSSELQNHLDGLSWGSHLLDLREYFNDCSNKG